MRKKWFWIIGIIVLLLIIGGGYLYFFNRGNAVEMGPDGQPIVVEEAGGGPPGFGPPGAAIQTRNLLIRPADDTIQVSATGNIALVNEETIVAKIEALITGVSVSLGDTVSTDELLVTLDSKDLQQAVDQAVFDLEASQIELDKLTQPPDPTEIKIAEAELSIAQDDLVLVKAGPTETERLEAENGTIQAWADYNKLLAGKSADELVGVEAGLRRAQNTVRRAQQAYDEIAWRHGASDDEAIALEEATISFEVAQADYNQQTKPATAEDIEAALSAATIAQSKLETLLNTPTPKELAEAELRVTQAQLKLDNLLKGPSEDQLTTALANVAKAQLALEKAETNLALAVLKAPFSGTIVAVKAKVGQTAQVNDDMVTVADLDEFKLTVSVAEADINRLSVGQKSEVTLDALPGQTFDGEVSYISPVSTTGNDGVVSYEVTIQLMDEDLADIRSGMTALVTFIDDSLQGAWLVPTSALQAQGAETVVGIIRAGQPLTITVEPGIVQGDWTVVQSAELAEGDEVSGDFTSYLDADGFFGNNNEER